MSEHISIKLTGESEMKDKQTSFPYELDTYLEQSVSETSHCPRDVEHFLIKSTGESEIKDKQTSFPYVLDTHLEQSVSEASECPRDVEHLSVKSTEEYEIEDEQTSFPYELNTNLEQSIFETSDCLRDVEMNIQRFIEERRKKSSMTKYEDEFVRKAEFFASKLTERKENIQNSYQALCSEPVSNARDFTEERIRIKSIQNKTDFLALEQAILLNENREIKEDNFRIGGEISSTTEENNEELVNKLEKVSSDLAQEKKRNCKLQTRNNILKKRLKDFEEKTERKNSKCLSQNDDSDACIDVERSNISIDKKSYNFKRKMKRMSARRDNQSHKIVRETTTHLQRQNKCAEVDRLRRKLDLMHRDRKEQMNILIEIKSNFKNNLQRFEKNILKKIKNTKSRSINEGNEQLLKKKDEEISRMKDEKLKLEDSLIISNQERKMLEEKINRMRQCYLSKIDWVISALKKRSSEKLGALRQKCEAKIEDLRMNNSILSDKIQFLQNRYWKISRICSGGSYLS